MLQLKCTGLNLTSLNALSCAEGSIDVPVTIEFDSTYNGYTKSLSVGYYNENGIEQNVSVSQENEQFMIPGPVFAQSGIIFISVHFQKEGVKFEPETNAVNYFVTKTAGGSGNLGARYSWEPVVKSFVDQYLTNNPPTVVTDLTLTKSGQAADAKVVGDKINSLKEDKVDKNDISLGVHTDGLIYIFIGGVPVGNGLNVSGGTVDTPDVYGQPTTDNNILKLTQNQTYTLGVKLDKQPNVNQTVTVLSNSSLLSFDTTELSFTPSNWNEFQYVTVTVGTFDEDTNANIILRNSDELMTDTNIQVYLQADMFTVDMTIPEGQHVLTPDDVTYTLSSGLFIISNYTGEYSNIYIPATFEVDGTTYTTYVNKGSGAFDDNSVLEYVEIDSNSTRIESQNLFKGCTNLIGLKWRCSNLTDIGNMFNGCTSFKWFDGLELNTEITSMSMTFYNCTSLEYIQDISALTKLTNMSQCFWLCPLKKIYGMPESFESPCNMDSAYYGTQLTSGVIPSNVSSAKHTFRNCANLKKAYVHEDNLTTTTLDNTFTGCSNVTVYANMGTSTYEALNEKFATIGTIILKDFSNESLPLIVTWGDSTTSEGTSWGCWPDRLQDKLGIDNFTVRNEAVSGEYTTSTSARQGGNTLKIVEEFTIPSSATPVTVPKIGTRDGRIFGQTGGNFRPYESFNPCTINGVVGTFTNTNGYQFTRLDEGEETVVQADTYVYSNQDDILNNSNVIMLVNLGINSGWNNISGDTSYSTGRPTPNDLITQMQLMVEHFQEKGGTKYILAGPSSGKFLENLEYLELVKEFETLAKNKFGNNFLNLREYLIQNGLTENGLTATEEDTTRIANGLVPKSLLCGNNAEDLTHPNSYGANSQMLAFYNKGVELGYWS